MKRIIQIIVAWLVKRLSPDFQDKKPREGLMASVADGSDNRERDSAGDARLINSHELLGGTPEHQAEASAPGVPIAAPQAKPENSIEERAEKVAESRLLSEKDAIIDAECSHVESEGRNPLPTGPVTIPKEEGGWPGAVIVDQEFQAQSGKSSEGKVFTPAIEHVAETDVQNAYPELPVAGAVSEAESVETVARSELNPGQSIDAADNAIATSPAKKDLAVLDEAEASAGSHDVESPTAIEDKGVADFSLSTIGTKKLSSSEPEWDAFSERPEVGSGKPGPAKTSEAIKGTEALIHGVEDSAEINSQGTKREIQPSAPIDFSAYEGSGLASLPDSYLYWNRILLERFVRVAAGGQILLATSPRALAAALFDDKDEPVPVSEAQGRFAEAVASAYKFGVVGSSARLRSFRRHVAPDGIPVCVAFLALSVLAAHKMHTDEISWSSDYYSRLSELLGVERGANGLPTDFRSDEFESLWLFFADFRFHPPTTEFHMSPQAGNLLLQEVAPRIKSAARHCINFVGSEDYEEVPQDAIALAARMLHNTEINGKKVTAGNIAYYALQHAKSGRRSVGFSNADTMATGTQLNHKSTVRSVQQPMPTADETEEYIFQELFECEQEDPSQSAARKLDWEVFMSMQTDRVRAILICMAEGNSLQSVAVHFHVEPSTIYEQKNRLAKSIKDFMGEDELALVIKQPEWKSNLRAMREKHTRTFAN